MYNRDPYLQASNQNSYLMHQSGKPLSMQNIQTHLPIDSPMPQMYYEPPSHNIPMENYPNSIPEMHYDQRYYWREGPPQNKPPSIPQPQMETYSPLNIVQRLSMLIKSQIHTLQPMMRYTSSNYYQMKHHYRRRSKSKSRSRSRNRDRDRHRKRSSSKEGSMQWLCRKCSFSNYEWRDKCKKCGEVHQSKGFVPGPQDWRCLKCSNINYARRNQCNRCGNPRQSK